MPKLPNSHRLAWPDDEDSIPMSSDFAHKAELPHNRKGRFISGLH